ncbi:hypothetical protein C453_09203 [Haloferax elongans ATCC BAA-1513]|uniref:Small CPxCG-related zinc finger protein n=1 Tax=Haloferax elongans ATCC BAA-1513 TaxID=1230453 RepID=M0HQJ8_HALEO|nr:hypothetical protein [Haloferax elongans]ELZ85982.1 hypothetical protein C453_09203 [Haloferax elongans ATCC BAA-1513]
MVDPTSDLEEDVDPADAPTCATCDEPIVNSPSHRVVTWVDDGETRQRHFCGDACRDDWDDER